MTLINDKFEETGLKKKKIAEKLDITTRTIHRWFNYDGIETIYTFMLLIKELNISRDEFINDYNKKKKV